MPPNDSPQLSRLLTRLEGFAMLSAVALIAATILLNFAAGSESVDDLRVFATDEASGTLRLQKMLEARSFDPHPFFNYGNAYPTSSYAVVRALQAFGYPLSETLLTLSLRFVSALSAFLSALLVYGSMRNLGAERSIARCVAVLSVAVGQVLFLGTMVHPDTMQMMFCAAVVYFLTRSSNPKDFALAAAAAGMAGATKYGGITFVLPVGAAMLARAWKTQNLREGTRRTGLALVASLGCLLLALAVFSVVNYHAWRHFEAFKEDVVFEMRHVTRGHNHAANPSPLLWGRTFSQELGALYSVLVFGGLLGGFCLSGWRTWKSRLEDERASLVFAIAAGSCCCW